MKNTLYYLFLVLILNSACQASSLPISLSNNVQQVEKLFKGSASTAYKLQLMIIAPGVFIDPAPNEASFGNEANVTISVDALSGYEFLHQVMADIRSSKWAKAPAPGYPRWYWRIVGPSESIVIGLLIDEENAAICHGGIWYKVDRNLVNRLTREFVDVATRTFLPTPENKIESTTGDTLPSLGSKDPAAHDAPAEAVTPSASSSSR